MAFQAVPDTVELSLIFTQNAETLVNTFHAKKPGGYDLAAVSALANSVDNSVDANLLPEMVADCVYDRTEVRGLATENDIFVVDGTNAGPGAILGPGMSNNVTLSIKKRSPFTGRSARGRVYFVGMPASALTTNENFYNPTQVQNKQIAWEALRITLVAAGWDPVIVSRFTGGLERPFGVVFDWIGMTAVNDAVDSQRGRLS